jgi:tetratricopeptide (TPR) repeat protein
MLLCLLLFLFAPILTSKTLEDDLKGLLPPVSADHSAMVAHIRGALQSKDFSGMGRKIDELIDQERTNPEGYFWKGFLELQRRDNYNAVRFLRRAEALDASCHVLKLLALSYYFLDQFQLFIGAMEEAMRKETSDFAPYYYLGRFYASSEAPDFSRAAGYFHEVLKRNPNHYASHYYLGYCYETERKFKDAEQEYRRSIELAEGAGNKYGLPYQGMARLRLLENRPAEARQFATQAVELAANDAESHLILAKAYAALGRAAQAAPEWERATLLDPTNAAPYYHLYRTYSALGNKEEASRALKKYNSLIAIYGSN